ncbi:MAG: sigma-54 dependent transcriptional regulator [Candidatus Brocadiaceae bacterium]|nr:sigma-54 dependent transcriptional regulator [Candidatus Brocadiaceae bacterium]
MRPAVRVLVIDDEDSHAKAAAEALEKVGYHCIVATEGREGLRHIRRGGRATPDGGFDVVITDLVMKDVDGMEVLKETREHLPRTQVIFLTGYGTVELAVAAMQKGATTFLQKPVNAHQLRIAVEEAIKKQTLVESFPQALRPWVKGLPFPEIVGRSPRMQRINSLLKQVAPTNATVLIGGESGTGKELIARSLHYYSPRKNRPFVVLNSAAIPEGLLESELFGHEKGAFTGAICQRKGKFEHAHRGTLLLDEIGDMPLAIQAKLLRVLEDGKVIKVGSNEPVPVDVRIVAATNKDLEGLVKAGKFREDLYFRLNVVSIKVPPLRERQDDVPLLIDCFLKEFSSTHGRGTCTITQEARKRLFNYPWPGNVRELRNCIESMVVMSLDGVLKVEDIPEHISSGRIWGLATVPPEKGPLARPMDPRDLVGVSIEEMEKELIKNTLASVGGNREASARLLGIGERTLYRKLDRYGLK